MMGLVSKKNPAFADTMDEVVDEASFRGKEGTREESNGPSNDEQTRRSASKPSNDNAADEVEERKERARRLMVDQKKTTLNPWKIYKHRKEKRIFQMQMEAEAAMAAEETAAESKERRRMVVEERRSWDAFELNIRNRNRMIEKERKDRAEAVEKSREKEEQRLVCEEEGLTFDEGIVQRYRRWRASPSLAAVLQAQSSGSVHAMHSSADGRWILTGGDDLTVRLWDTEGFTNRTLADPDGNISDHAAEQAGAVAADVALGWECVRELEGHAAAVRDVAIPPNFGGTPSTETLGAPLLENNGGDESASSVIANAQARKNGEMRREAARPTGVEYMLASASADLTVRIWDLSFNPRIARFILRGHKGVVYSCRFSPSGDRLATCSADKSVRLWNVLEGTEVFCYLGHVSPVSSICFSPTGRYIVSCSDIGERAIRLWFAGMPLYDRNPALFGLRLRWARSGLVKRITSCSDPSSMAFFLDHQEERERRESSDESEGEKEHRKSMRIPKSVLDQCDENPCPSQAISNGFSLIVTLLNDSGKDVLTDEYYRGCKLVLRVRAQNRFTGLYIAGVSAEGLWEGFDVSLAARELFVGETQSWGPEGRQIRSRGGCRYGSFFRDVPEGISLTAARSIASGEDLNKAAGGIHDATLLWKANSQLGVGWLMIRAVFRYPVPVGGEMVLGRETVWVTLRERPPPMPPAALLAASGLKPRKRNFDTIERTRLFARALKSSDWAEAAMMLSASVTIKSSKLKVSGAAKVTQEIRKALGRNIIVGTGLSVGVAWTSIRMTHEPPEATRINRETPGNGTEILSSPGPPLSTDVSMLGRRDADSKLQRTIPPKGEGSAGVRADVARSGKGDYGSFERHGLSRSEKRKRNGRKDKERRVGTGTDTKMIHNAGDPTGDNDGGTALGRTVNGARQMFVKKWQRRQPRQEGWRTGQPDPSARTQSTWGKSRVGRQNPRGTRRTRSAGGPSSDEEKEAAIFRASVERKLRSEMKYLAHLRRAGVEAWKELGDKTGALVQSKARKRAATAKARDGSNGLLSAVGIAVRDPQENLKVLVWDDHFGADVPELRMRLPELYPTPVVPDDEYEDVSSSALEAAVAIGERASKEIMGEIRVEREGNKADNVHEIVEAVLARDRRLRKIAVRRRNALVSPEDLAACYPEPAPRLAPLRRLARLNNGNRVQPEESKHDGDEDGDEDKSKSGGGMKPRLPTLDTNTIHKKLEGAADRKKRLKKAEKFRGGDSPVRALTEFDLERRRGGLGTLPGAAALVEAPAVGDWEKKVARKRGGLLREFKNHFGGRFCHQDGINAVTYSPDGRRLASASSDGTIKLWDPFTSKQMRVLSGNHHEGSPVWDVAWSSDSVFLVSCGADRSIVIWNTAAGEPFVRRFVGHSDQVRRCAFMGGEKGEAILSCGSDGTVRKWVLTPNVPAPPPKPFVTQKTRTWVMLNWQPAAGSNEEVLAYAVSCRLGRRGEFDQELTVPGDQVKRDIIGLFPGSEYFFRVAAINRMGRGPWSEISNMVNTEMDLPRRIERPVVEAITSTTITISFFARRNTISNMKITSFVVQAKGAGLDFDDSEAMVISREDALSRGAELKASEKALRRDNRSRLASTLMAPSNKKTRTRDIRRRFRRHKAHHNLMVITYGGLSPGKDYHIRVAGANSVGQGEFSIPTYSTRIPAVCPGPCPPPTHEAFSPTAIAVCWTEGDNGGAAFTGFVVRLTSGGMMEEKKCSRTTRTFIFEGLRKGHPYFFQVRAVNNKGASPWSEASKTAWTLTECPAPPRAPVIARSRIPPGPLSMSLSLNLPDDDGGDSITALLLEMREHGGARLPEWSRCDHYPVLPARVPVANEEPVGQASREHDTGDFGTANSTVCNEIIVVVDNLKPRTYYSFRTSAINGNGPGKPSPPSRRIRTSPAQPPSWVVTTGNFVRGCPRATCSGIEACTVLWDEPISNGAQIESYVVETAMILGPAQLSGAASVDDQASVKGGSEVSKNGNGKSSPQNGLLVKTEPESKGKSPQVVAGTAMGSVVVVKEPPSGQTPVIRQHEIIKHLTHVIVSPTRHAVIRGLTTGVEYAFRVAGTNAAGRGKPGPWSEVVQVVDCANDFD